MEKISPKMAAAFGVGFMGFILAAYSYNQQHKEEYIPTDDENDVRNKVMNTEKKKEHLEKIILDGNLIHIWKICMKVLKD